MASEVAAVAAASLPTSTAALLCCGTHYCTTESNGCCYLQEGKGMESNRGFSPIRSVPASATTTGVWKVVALPEEGEKSGKRGGGREMHWREGRTYTGGGGEEEQPLASLNQPRSEAEASFFLPSPSPELGVKNGRTRIVIYVTPEGELDWQKRERGRKNIFRKWDKANFNSETLNFFLLCDPTRVRSHERIRPRKEKGGGEEKTLKNPLPPPPIPLSLLC